MLRVHMLLILLIPWGFTWAQGGVLETASLDRSEEFVEFEAGELAGIGGEPIDALAFYSWRGGSFLSIPYQVDEVGPNGGYFGEDEDPGNFDSNDEIVFVLADAGDRVDCEVWAAAADTTRYEIEVEDPLNPGEKAWVYIFTGDDVVRSTADYVEIVAENPLAINTTYYAEDFLPDGPATQTGMIIHPDRGNDTDFMDRLKLRTKLFSFGGWETEEASDIDPARHHLKDGQIRILNSFFVSLGDLIDLSHVVVTFYPQMTTVDNAVNQILPTGVQAMVWLEDLAPVADGNFYYYDNRGEDPEADATFSDLVDGDGTQATGEWAVFFEWASATFGRTVFVQDPQPVLDLGGDASVLSYYCDGCPDAPWPDTGDMEKWGEFATWIKKIPFSQFDIQAWNFRLSGENPQISIGGEYTRRYFHRVTHLIETQYQCPVSIGGESPPSPPQGLTLGQNRPNPFNPRTEIRFTVPENAGQTTLGVFDLGGRLIRTLLQSELPTGEHALSWDGRDQQGRSVTSGIYFYRLEVGEELLTRRMVLIK